MIVKAGGAIALLIGGLYAGGMFDPGYSREVARPQAAVMHALEDLDITSQPGAPGTDPSRAGGVTPVFKLERTADSMIWTVMSGKQVATRMIADFKPVDATHTKVTARVERGDAPDDFVSPAFRSRGITLGLFGLALESELNDLTRPATNSAGCEKLREDMQDRMTDMAIASRMQDQGRPKSVGGAIGDGAKVIMALNAAEGEQRRLGCDTDGEPGFIAPTEIMRPADSPVPGVRSRGTVSFKPGEPMVDPTISDPQ